MLVIYAAWRTQLAGLVGTGFLPPDASASSMHGTAGQEGSGADLGIRPTVETRHARAKVKPAGS
jgi:hypothetical protein